MNSFVSKIEWLDNSEAKEKIKSWLSEPWLTSERRLSAFIVDCPQQLMDLSDWIQNNTSRNTIIGEFITQDDTLNMKSRLIEDLVENLMVKGLEFETYYSKLNQIDSLGKIPINYSQEINIKATLGGAKTEDINQNVNIYLDSERLMPEFLRETNIKLLHDSFLEDLAINGSNVLLLIMFGGNVLSKLISFKNWFIDIFCRKTIQKPNVKICVINSEDIEEIYVKNIYIEKFGTIGKEAFLKEAEKYILNDEIRAAFCCGIIDFNEHNPLPYKNVKLALSRLLNIFKTENQI